MFNTSIVALEFCDYIMKVTQVGSHVMEGNLQKDYIEMNTLVTIKCAHYKRLYVSVLTTYKHYDSFYF